MTPALIAGCGVGVGLVVLLSGLIPAPVPLDLALASLRRRHPTPLGFTDGPRHSPITRLLGVPLVETPLGARLAGEDAADLRITNTTAAEHVSQRAAFFALGLLWAPVTTALMWAGGVHVGFVFPLWVSLALAPVGFLYPTLLLKSKAAERRRSFRHAFSSFLDIVSISLAGGRGVDSALHDGAEAGSGWAFDELRRALLEARLLGETPWAGLARLGQDLAVPELGELAASAALAGDEGARVRSSLAAKARSLRLHGLADIETAAQAATERMTLPVVLLMLGFIVFLVYPAIEQVLHGI
ncbi:MAG TPA: type II secretion system F family protein [Acidimicrobiales bacterium]|nr:type II secretion system F family protein [Acidimicrobiales bacterium]HVV37328.1 type II secretion system F family protein [Acidimicrobiales bacterium]